VRDNEHLILGGDFNCVLDPVMDNISGRNHDSGLIQTFQDVCTSLKLYDTWRLLNNDEKIFTWRHKSKSISRRIDYIFMNEICFEKCVFAGIIDIPLTDHRGVWVEWEDESGGATSEKGPSYWKLNNTILKEPAYVNGINNLIADLEEKCSQLDPLIKWDYIKTQIKTFSLHYCISRASNKKSEETYIYRRIKQLNTDLAKYPDNLELQAEINKLMTKLEVIEIEKARGAMLRSKIEEMEYGERNTTFFHSMEKSKAKKNLINTLITEDGNVLNEVTDILKEEVRYFSSIYQNKNEFSQDMFDDFTSNIDIPQIAAADKANLDKELTYVEVGKALSTLKNTSSPGSDGLTAAWYKVFWVRVKHILMDCYKSSLNKGYMSVSQRRCIITLLYKGKDLERNKLDNWRPISLSNVDYKILAKVFAIRLKTCAGKLINGDQNGFIQGRSIARVIRVLDDIIEITKTDNIQGCIIALDYKKAFDSISKEYLVNCFRKYGFGDEFLKWINILNNLVVGSIHQNGWLTEWFPISAGVRQGCPISPLCFVFAIEILSCKIRQSENIKGIKLPGNIGIKIVQYADDTTLTLSDEESIHTAFEIIKWFSKFTGLTLNKNKTEAIWIGCWKHRHKVVDRIKWNTGIDSRIKILGFYISNSKTLRELPEMWEDKFRKCENIIKLWNIRKLSIIGKIQVVKSYLLSQFTHILQAVILPDNILHRINLFMFRYIWGNSKYYKEKDIVKYSVKRVKRDRVCLPKEKGGLGMVNIKHMQYAFSVKWISYLENDDTTTLHMIAKYYYGKIMMNWRNIFFTSVKLDKFKGLQNIPTFYYELLRTFLEIKHMEDSYGCIKCTLLWNNRNILFMGQPIYIKEWIDKGIFFVEDVLQNGQLSLDKIGENVERTTRIYFNYNIVCNPVKNYLNKMENCDHPCGLITVFGKSITQLTTKCIRHNIAENAIIDNNTQLHQSDIWPILIQTTSSSSLFLLQWKIQHNIFPCGVYLNKIKIQDNDTCAYCHNSTQDSIHHYFIQCPLLQEYWNHIINIILTRHKISINRTQILEGCENVVANRIILLAKYAIYVSKMRKSTCYVLEFERQCMYFDGLM